MLPLKSVLYLFLLVGVCFGSIFYSPVLGILGYLFTYNVNPAGQWWGQPISRLGFRYSELLVIATAVGMVIHVSKLKYGKLFTFQEVLLIVFLGLIWLSIPLGLGFDAADSNAMKMTKIVVILLMASHVITTMRSFEAMVWVLILSALLLGYSTFTAPDYMFRGARFQAGVGGSDFKEGNFLGAHFAMLLPFMGIVFLKDGWKAKALCLVTGVLAVNAIILCRSRGVFLATAIGCCAAIVCAPREYRNRIMAGIAVGLLGGVLLTDPGFWTRMDTISIEQEQMDASSYGRVMLWKAALEITADHPFGIGEGNYKRIVGHYLPEREGKDTHNTYLRCLSELGIQGLMVYLLLAANAVKIIYRIQRRVSESGVNTNFHWYVYGLKISLVIFLAAGMTITQTYIEELYWVLFFPVFLERALDNEIEERSILEQSV